MTTVVTRIPKGSPLTWLEEDTNFNNLNNYKLESVAVSTTASRITKSGSPITTSDGTGGTIALDLATTAVTPGSYTNTALTVDAYGRLTAASSGSGASSDETLATNRLLSEIHEWAMFGGNGTEITWQGWPGQAGTGAGSTVYGHAYAIPDDAKAVYRRNSTTWNTVSSAFGMAWPSYTSTHKIPSGTVTGGFYMMADWFFNEAPSAMSQYFFGITDGGGYDEDPVEEQGGNDSIGLCYPSVGGNIRVARTVSGTTTLTDTGVAMPLEEVGHRWIVYCNPANGQFTLSITSLTSATNLYDNVLYSNTFTSGLPAATGTVYFPVWGGPGLNPSASISTHRVAGWYKL